MAKSLWRNRSFVSMVATQFLGAFNDNAFKQLVLLVAVDFVAEGESDSYQAIATGLFALPFILFSGFAGNLSDRFSKTSIIRVCKFAEIGVMALGGLAFWSGSMEFLLATVFLMGAQSAFFGPAKYGVLPELVPRESLSRANGVIMMTTFLSIILGMAAAGFLRDAFGGALYKPQLVYIVLAGIGTWSAFGIRRLPAADPQLAVLRRPFGDLFSTLKQILSDGSFVCVVAANSYFWFLGAVVQQLINVYGLKLMGLNNFGTSALLVSLSAGMAAGSIIGGWLSKSRLRLELTDYAMVVIVLSLVLLTWGHLRVELAHVALFALGFGGGLFGLPLQTCVQLWPPDEEKGRVVAAVNFTNWVFIFLSAGYFAAATAIAGPHVQYIATSLAVLSAIGWLLLRPRLMRAAKELGGE